MNETITSKVYFWLAILVPLILSLITALIIYLDINPVFCFSKSCLEYFMEAYSIPLKLIGITLVLLGAAFTYYRIELTYRQNERQIYGSFRDEFLDIMKAKDHKYEILDIPDIWLFNNLYPNAKTGDQKLLPEFEEFITYEDDQNQGFTGAMKNLANVIGTKEQYHAGAHFPIGNMYLWLRDIIPIDADLNIGYMAGAPFEGDYAKYIIELGKDIFFIVNSVNAFEGWKFFDNKSKRLWRKNIDRLPGIERESRLIQIFFKNAIKAQWIISLINGNIPKFKTFDINKVMHSDIVNNKNAKEYIFEAWTSKKGTNIINEEAAVAALKEKLNIK